MASFNEKDEKWRLRFLCTRLHCYEATKNYCFSMIGATLVLFIFKVFFGWSSDTTPTLIAFGLLTLPCPFLLIATYKKDCRFIVPALIIFASTMLATFALLFVLVYFFIFPQSEWPNTTMVMDLNNKENRSASARRWACFRIFIFLLPAWLLYIFYLRISLKCYHFLKEKAEFERTQEAV